jgi:hypothetical protein
MNTEYQDYLNSSEWRLRRKKRLMIGKNKCAVCGTKRNLHVHHLTYERVMNEDMEDLIPLCEKHHSEIEEHIKAGRLGRTGHPLFLITETMRLLAHKPEPKKRAKLSKAARRAARKAARELVRLKRIEKKQREPQGFAPPRQKWTVLTEQERQLKAAARMALK